LLYLSKGFYVIRSSCVISKMRRETRLGQNKVLKFNLIDPCTTTLFFQTFRPPFSPPDHPRTPYPGPPNAIWCPPPSPKFSCLSVSICHRCGNKSSCRTPVRQPFAALYLACLGSVCRLFLCTRLQMLQPTR